MIRAAKWPLDILPAKLIKIIKKRKEIKNNSSKMTTKSTFLRTQNIKPCLIREKVVTFRMVKLNMLLSIFLITK